MTTGDSSRATSTLIPAVVVATGAMAAGPAVWWIGDRLNTIGEQTSDPDYLIEPLQIYSMTTDIVGVSSIILALLGAVTLYAMVRAGRWPLAAAGLATTAAAATSYAGVTYSVATAPVIGANIGAGLLIIAAAPVGGCLLVGAGFSIVRIHRGRHRTAAGSPAATT